MNRMKKDDKKITKGRLKRINFVLNKVIKGKQSETNLEETDKIVHLFSVWNWFKKPFSPVQSVKFLHKNKLSLRTRCVF